MMGRMSGTLCVVGMMLMIGFTPIGVSWPFMEKNLENGNEQTSNAQTISSSEIGVDYTGGSMAPLNDQARSVLQTNEVWYARYNGYHANLMGEDQIVGIADTGFDMGSTTNALEDFKSGPLGNRLVSITGADDTVGHGTHVAGSIVGNGYNCEQYKGFSTTDREYDLCYAGQAPEGKLISTAGLTTGNWASMISAGAHVLSNSWGPATPTEYDSSAQTTDQMMNADSSVLILFSAGNAGPSLNTVSGGANSWNGLGICGSISDKPEAGSLNPDEVVSYSSRGGATWLNGRIKPDVCVPGTAIYSTKARTASSGGGSGDLPIDANGDGKPDYTSREGTDIATSIASGASLLVRDYLVDVKGISDPDSVLIKALLINGAQDMGYGFPSYVQGWGRLNARNSISPPSPRTNQYLEKTLVTSETWNPGLNLNVLSGKVPVKVTLVWQNPAGATLQNHVDLTVTSPSGTKYHGNKFQPISQWSQANPTGYDDINNVEQVQVQNPETGTWAIEVKAGTITSGGLSAVVFSADVGPVLDYRLELNGQIPHFVTKAPVSINYSMNLTNFGLNSDHVQMSTGSLPGGFSVTYNHTSPIPISSKEIISITAQIDIAGGTANGSYRFDLIAESQDDPLTPKTSARMTVIIDIYGTDTGYLKRISTSQLNDIDPAILTFKNATGIKHVFISWVGATTQGNRIFMKHSSDSGVTFGSQIQVSTMNDGPSYLRITWMPETASNYKGRVFVSWTGTNPAKDWGGSWAYMAYADPSDYDSQSTWQSHNVLVDENTGSGTGNIKRVEGILTMQSTTEVWLYFEHLDYANQGDAYPQKVDIHIRKSTDGGTTWGAATLISPGSVEYFFFPNGVVDKHDNIHIYFYGRASGSGVNDRDLYVRIYKSGSWQAYKKIWDDGDSRMFPAAEVTDEGTNGNRVYVICTRSATSDSAKKYWAMYTDDEGSTYLAPKGPFGQNVSAANQYITPVLDIDAIFYAASTRLYVTYLEESNPYGTLNIASAWTGDGFGSTSTQFITHDSLAKVHQMTDTIDATIYTVYSARNPATGNKMDIYLKIYGPFVDLDPPYVVSTAPTEGTIDVPANTKIDIVWNESMDHASAESAFSASPSITCIWSWSGNTQTCTPSTDLLLNTYYTITISTSARDLSSNHMTSQFKLNFTTSPNPPVGPDVNPMIVVTIVFIGCIIMLRRKNKAA